MYYDSYKALQTTWVVKINIRAKLKETLIISNITKKQRSIAAENSLRKFWSWKQFMKLFVITIWSHWGRFSNFMLQSWAFRLLGMQNINLKTFLRQINHLIQIDEKPNLELKEPRWEIYKISISFNFHSKIYFHNSIILYKLLLSC